jgi:uncharacterized protein
MKMRHFVRRIHLSAPIETVFTWHQREGAFHRLTPPWMKVQVLLADKSLEDGATVVLNIYVAGFPIRWELVHQNYEAGKQFEDIQRKGPFSYWKHTHRFIPQGVDSCILEDDMEYAMPGGILGYYLARFFIEPQLKKLFQYRHQIMCQDMALYQAYKQGEST